LLKTVTLLLPVTVTAASDPVFFNTKLPETAQAQFPASVVQAGGPQSQHPLPREKWAAITRTAYVLA